MIVARFEAGAIRRLAGQSKRWQRDQKAMVARELEKGANNIRNESIRRLNNFADTGRLKNDMYLQKRKGGLNFLIGNRVKYAPYHEFGTGRRVNLTELRKAGYPETFALQFKGRGIRKVNLRPRPFFFPAINAESPKTIKAIKEQIRKNAKKF